MELEQKEPPKVTTETEQIEDTKSPSLMTRLKDPVYRGQLLRWACLPVQVFSVGICDSLAGTTLLDLQIITSTDQETAAYFLTSLNLGYLLGSLLGGFFHGKINSYLILILTGFLTGGACIATPFCPTFATMFIIRCTVGFFLGINLCIITTEHMCIWRTNGEALLQLINCVYAIGGVVGPLMTSPFLADKETTNKTLSTQNSTLDLYINQTDHANSTFGNMTEHTNSTQSHVQRTTNVHYAFLIAGIIVMVASIPAFFALLLAKKADQPAKEDEEECVGRKLPLSLTIFMVAIIFCYFFFYCCVEVTFASFLMTFVVEQYEEVTTHEGAYITTFFWSAFAAARFVSIFISKSINASRQLYLHLSLLVCAFSGFLASGLFSRIDILTGFTCMAGIACSAIYGASMSWVEAEVMKVTGPISSVMLIGSSAGATAIPIVVGHLMKHKSNLWFCYSLMVAIGLALSFFVFLLTFNKLYMNRKYGKLYAANSKDKQENTTDNGNVAV